MTPGRINPSIGKAFTDVKADYNAARTSRFRRRRTGVAALGSGADYHYRSESDFMRMIECARDMDRNDVIVGQMVDRAVLNTVQGGIRPDPQTGDTGVDAELALRFTAWADDPETCDAMGELTFWEQQAQVLRSTFVDGDILGLPLEDGPLQLVEGHRLRKPTNTTRNVVNGILLDEDRRPIEYWFTKDDIDPHISLSRVSDIERYDAYDGQGNPTVFHMKRGKRSTQTRGVTAFAPIFDQLGMFEDITFAKLVQQQAVSCIAFIRNQEMGAPVDGDNTSSYGDTTTETLTSGATRLIDEIAPGMEIVSKPGEKIEGFSPSVPNSEFFQHARLTLQLIGVNIGMPLILLLMDGSETNFTGWRGALDQAHMGFRDNQRWLINRFCRKVWSWKVREFLENDLALRKAAARLETQNNDIHRHEWNAPGWKYIQPLQDAQGDALRLEKRLTSPRRIHTDRGQDYAVIASEIVDDNKLLILKALEARDEVAEQHPSDTIDWREFLHVPNVIDQKPGLPSAPTTTTVEEVNQA
ncbi:MAG: phage portal protein [Planctomycetota bacterium]